MITWIVKVTCDRYDCKSEEEAVIILKSDNVIDIDLPQGWYLRYQEAYPDSRRDVNDSSRMPNYETLCPPHK